jgi:hypothetical protein
MNFESMVCGGSGCGTDTGDVVDQACSQDVAVSASMGRPKCQPCAASQPMSRRNCAVRASSTPSATERSPRVRTRSMIDLTITTSSEALLSPA